MTSETLTLENVRAEAKKKLKGFCNVYKDCDGDPSRLCQGQHYGKTLGIGGTGSGASFHNNWLALRAIRLKMRVAADDFAPDTSFSFFGRQLSMPVMAASISGVNSFGGEEVMTEQDFCRAIVFGCNDADTLGWRGDTYTYTLERSFGLDTIAEGGKGGVKIVKPREQSKIKAFFKKAETCGATAVGVDIDGCGSVHMTANNQKVFRKSPDDIRELVECTTLPVIIKGVMSSEDAVTAADAGAAAIVVSNHGGRVLDHTPGTAEVLPGICDALGDRDVVVLADGGIRTGYDVLKMLALGASAVLVGRDTIRAAVGGGAEGVRLQMDYFRKTLAKAMLMTGCPTLADVSADILEAV